ncbi:4-hydroxybenzoate transporter PcaK [Pseudomonas oleovorans subsp. oleovorans]|jgi:AAHS family benzoate transporter-like MFS transporter|uniref:Major facilitator superfamily transporter n=1 Tax=Ectopseudomonas oleovorans TaxID=301 RepID=A0A379JQB9_ECTOL|nr:MFS transporter [Pseudomonas oleovorans]OWK48512.1 4-hydroxybenzoate transporter PcaK [Pseudomonas oleovorans subsp. oleovorans]SEJ27111.1 MFS transporter, AAHS family, benzoate transport protein [Pseudomonas oleovorans]SUD50544.1 major facilitator superfamily transporter [Pseudomonas oleovorans]
MRQIDVHPVIDNARFSRFHWMVMALCALLLIFDGYDLFIFGVVLPSIMQEWGLTPLEAGALGSYALFGMMFGALGFGTLADRIGRKKGIAICFVLFSTATILNGFASNPTEFGIFRFIAGLGCGGLMPNAVALMNEYAPKRLRSTLVAVMFSGYSLGGMLAAGVGIYMLPRFGWESMFFAAAVPLLLLPLILWKLPESVGFLVRQGRHEQARAVLAKVEPGLALDAADQLLMSDAKGQGVGVFELFRDGRALRTLCLWLAFFCCLLMVYALSSWLPKLMANAGYSLGSSLSFLLALNFGGMAGAILGGWLGDRFNLGKVMVAFFVAAAASISLLGFNSPTPVLYGLIFIAGATTIGTQILLYAGAAQFYGLSIRSTGLGWASGIGRNGAIVGPLLGGALMAINLPLQLNFIAFAVPGAIAALAMAVFTLSGQRRQAASAAMAAAKA